MAQSGTVTILFTDLVNSTELLQRAGDDDAQRIFQAHQKLLRDAVSSHGGHEVKWLGDGLMVAFPSAADAVRCAVAVQQAARRPARGERLGVRIGLNAGEALRDEDDYFGTSVVVARRLCDRAEAGQILCSALVSGLLSGRQAFLFRELGDLDLKGIAAPIAACEVVYERGERGAFLSHTPFVGRRSETARLCQQLEEARAGHGGFVMLIGEPGIGKTRLAEEFCETARAAGAVIATGRCYEGDLSAPYRPWVEALRSHAAVFDDGTLRNQMGQGAAAVLTLLPELRGRFPDIEEAPRLEPEEERFRLFDGIRQFLRGAASSTDALVLFLDDLQWADRPSLVLLEHLARSVSSERILVLGTYRDVEVDRGHPLSETLAALRRNEYFQRLVMGGLAEDSIDELLETIEPSVETTGRKALAAALHRETEGNPFFLREVLAQLIQTGKLGREGGGGTAVASIHDLDIPDGVRDAIDRRLSRLSEGCRRMLMRASAMAAGFTWEALAVIGEEPEARLLDYLDEALDAQVLAEQRGSASYDFTHALIRHTLYDGYSIPRRALLHQQIAEALETLYVNDPDPHVAELAHHFLAAQGSGAGKAIDYSVRAGERAMAHYAWEEAERHFDLGLQAMQPTPAAEDARATTLLLRVGEARANAGHLEGALASYRRAASAARRLSLAETLAGAAVGVQRVAYRMAGDVDLSREALALLDDALALLGTEDSALRVMVLSQRVPAAAAAAGSDLFRTRGYGAYAGDKDPRLIDQAREAVAMAERLDDPGLTAMALEQLRAIMRTPGNAAERLALSTRTIALGLRGESVQQELEGRSDRAADLLDLGEIDEVLRETELMLSRALETRLLRFVSQGIGARAGLAMAQGKLQEAEPLVFEAFRMGQEVHEADAVTRFGGQLFTLRWLQGRLGELEGTFASAVEQSPNVPSYRAGLARIHCELGRRDEARAGLQHLAGRDFRDIPQDFLWPVTVMFLSDVCAALGDRERAEPLYRLLSPFATLNVATALVMTHGAASRALGSLATVLRRWEDADHHFQFAIEMNTRMGFPPFVAMTQFDYARMLLARGRRGDRDHAAPLLEAALARFRDIGMDGWVQRAEELEQRIEQGGAAQAVHPDGLTPREVEVLQLIAAGRTNSEIASDLTLSVRTVARHITNIYNKIGVRNKVEATAYAHRHSLE